MTRKNGIDLFRLIGAFFIICLHTDFGSLDKDYTDNLRLLSRWAVPFYFIATGFFLGYKIDNNILDFQRIQKNVSVLISILIVTTVVYLPINLLKGELPKTIANLLTGSYYHLWFIGSLLVGYIFIWYLFFIKKSRLLPYISICFLLFALFADSYDQLLHKNISYGLFRFLLSIPLMYTGVILSKKELTPINQKIFMGVVFAGLILQFIEAELFLSLFDYQKYQHQFLIGTIVTSISIFVWSAKLNLQENIFSDWGRKYSLFIYLYHQVTYFIMRSIYNITFSTDEHTIKIFFPVIGFVLTLGFAITLDMSFPKLFRAMNGNLDDIPETKKK